MYTLQEKIQIVKWYLISESAEEVIGRFIVTFPDRPVPTIPTILNIYHRFETSGCLTGCRKCIGDREKKPLTDEREAREVEICALVETKGPCSSTKIAEEVEVPTQTVRDILKRNGYKCYKMQRTQEIFAEDQMKRMDFCEAMREKIDRDPNFVKQILFTDECSFFLHGSANPQVTYWSRENKHLSVPVRTQYQQKVNVWVGILNDSIIGPIFIDGNLNAVKYLDMLRNQIIPAVLVVNGNLQGIWFQQDGCPAHNSREVMNFLEATFPERLIASRGTINWPPRSPDLSPNDFFLWGYMKQKIFGHFQERPRNLNDLRAKIIDVLENIGPEVLANVRNEFYNRLGYCEAQQGNIFEPLL